MFPIWGRESLTHSIGLSNQKVRAESMERHSDGSIRLTNACTSPNAPSGCQNSHPTHQIPLSNSPGVPPAEGPGGLGGRYWNRDRQMLQHSRFVRFKIDILPLQTYSLHSWAAINRVVLIEEKETKNKTKQYQKTKTPPSRQHRLKMIALIRCGQGGQEACRVHTYSSCCPQPEARGRWLQAGCRAGVLFGGALKPPGATKGKTTVG